MSNHHHQHVVDGEDVENDGYIDMYNDDDITDDHTDPVPPQTPQSSQPQIPQAPHQATTTAIANNLSTHSISLITKYRMMNEERIDKLNATQRNALSSSVEATKTTRLYKQNTNNINLLLSQTSTQVSTLRNILACVAVQQK